MKRMYAKFAKLLTEHGVNANQVSKATGVATSTLTCWKQGKYQPKANKIAAIAKFFDVPIDYFSNDEREDDEMPKVTPCIDDLDIEIRSTIGSVIYAFEINQADLATLIGLTPTTLGARMKCPGTFRAEELRRIAEVAKRGGFDAEFRI